MILLYFAQPKRFNESPVTMHNVKSIGKLIDDNAGRHKRQHSTDKQGDREEEFEYYSEENTNNQDALDLGNRSIDGPVVRFTNGPIARPPMIPVCPFATVPIQRDQAREWISEYTAQQAHEQRLHDDNDPEKMAEAAAQLLSQMDLQDDEKLKNSRFVAYLRQLSNGYHSQSNMSSTDQDALEKSAFTEWRQQYMESISPLVTNEEQDSWDAIVKDWQTYEARGLGYEGFAQREFVYEFYYSAAQDNPFSESGNLQQVAHQLMSDGRTSQAIMAYEASVQRDPSALNWFHLAQLQVENEQDILAIAAFQRALQLDPSLTNGWIEMAGCLVNEQCQQEAINALINYLQNIPKYNSRNVPASNTDPSLLISECLNCYENISREFSEDSNLLIALSILYCLSGDRERGIESIARALESEHDLHTRLVLENRMGALHANSGNYATALRLYDQIIARRPEMIRAHYNRGVSLLNGADYTAAIQAFTSAITHQLIPSSAGVMRPEIAHGLNHVWDVLRLACEMADRPDLVIAAKAHDIGPFRK